MTSAKTKPEIIVTEAAYGPDVIHEIIHPSVGVFGRVDSVTSLNLSGCHKVGDGDGVKVALLGGDVDYLSTVCYNWSRQLWESGTQDGLPYDAHGLGTALLMLLASDGTGGMPIGVAPGADYRIYPVLGTGGCVDEKEAVEAVDKSVAWGADVVVIPWSHWSPSRALSAAVVRAERAGVMVFCPQPTVAGARSDDTHFDEIESVITVGRCGASGVRPPTPPGHGGPVLFGPTGPVLVGGTCHRIFSISGPAVATCVVAGLYALILSLVKPCEQLSHQRVSAALQLMLCDTLLAGGERRDPGECGIPDVLPCLTAFGGATKPARATPRDPDSLAGGWHEIETRRA